MLPPDDANNAESRHNPAHLAPFAVIIASDGTVVKDNGEWKRLSSSYRYELPTLRSKLTELESQLATEKAKRQGAEAACDYMARELATAQADLERELRAPRVACSPPDPTLPLAARVVELTEKLSASEAALGRYKAMFAKLAPEVRNELKKQYGAQAADSDEAVIANLRHRLEKAESESRAGLEFVKNVLDILGLDHKGHGLYSANLTALRKLKTQLRNEVSANEYLKYTLAEERERTANERALREYAEGQLVAADKRVKVLDDQLANAKDAPAEMIVEFENAVDLRVKAAQDALTDEKSLHDEKRRWVKQLQAEYASTSSALARYKAMFAKLAPEVRNELKKQYGVDGDQAKPAGLERFWLTRQDLIDACIAAAFKAGNESAHSPGPSPALMYLAEELRK